MQKLIKNVSSIKTVYLLLAYLVLLLLAIFLTCLVAYLTSSDPDYLLDEVNWKTKDEVPYIIVSFMVVALISLGNITILKNSKNNAIRAFVLYGMILGFIGVVISYVTLLGFFEVENLRRCGPVGDTCHDGLSVIWGIGLCADTLAFFCFLGTGIARLIEKTKQKNRKK